jgi:hypothetical protein
LIEYPKYCIVEFQVDYLVGVISSRDCVVVVVRDVIGSAGSVQGSRAVTADDGGNVSRPRNALVLQQLDA